MRLTTGILLPVGAVLTILCLTTPAFATPALVLNPNGVLYTSGTSLTCDFGTVSLGYTLFVVLVFYASRRKIETDAQKVSRLIGGPVYLRKVDVHRKPMAVRKKRS